MSTRSALIIHPATYWALPTRIVSEQRGRQLHDDGTCRFCGHNESEDLGFVVDECPYLSCANEFEQTTWARCSCCDELVPADLPCRASLDAWIQATEEARGIVRVAG